MKMVRPWVVIIGLVAVASAIDIPSEDELTNSVMQHFERLGRNMRATHLAKGVSANEHPLAFPEPDVEQIAFQHHKLHYLRPGHEEFEQLSDLVTSFLELKLEDEGIPAHTVNYEGLDVSDIISEIHDADKDVHQNPDGDHDHAQNLMHRVALSSFLALQAKHPSPDSIRDSLVNDNVSSKNQARRDICISNDDSAESENVEIDQEDMNKVNSNSVDKGDIASKPSVWAPVMSAGTSLLEGLNEWRKLFKFHMGLEVFPEPVPEFVVGCHPLRQCFVAFGKAMVQLVRFLGQLVKALAKVFVGAVKRLVSKITGHSFRESQESEPEPEVEYDSMLMGQSEYEHQKELCTECDLHLEFVFELTWKFWETMKIKIVNPAANSLKKFVMAEECGACAKLVKRLFEKKTYVKKYFQECNPHSVGLCTILAGARTCAEVEAVSIRDADGFANTLPGAFLNKRGWKTRTKKFSMTEVCRGLENFELQLAAQAGGGDHIDKLQCAVSPKTPPFPLKEGCMEMRDNLSKQRNRNDNCLFHVPDKIFEDCVSFLKCPKPRLGADDVKEEMKADFIYELADQVEDLLRDARMKLGFDDPKEKIAALFQKAEEELESLDGRVNDEMTRRNAEFAWLLDPRHTFSHRLWNGDCLKSPAKILNQLVPLGRAVKNQDPNPWLTHFYTPVHNVIKNCKGAFALGTSDLD